VLPAASDLSYDAPAYAELLVQQDRGLLSRRGGGTAPTGRKAVINDRPAHGKLELSASDGGFKYTPGLDYPKGPDAFTFHVEVTGAGGSVLKSATRTVSLNIGGGLGQTAGWRSRLGAGGGGGD
jgi:hypothetical protein